ncbi:MAG TPA: protein translocase subunit SecD [Deltaproteobacteria bacterium]|nr:protein translocase subunit SecD [Deltaproteobacteria bacterium]HOM28417.1 protein translocase subunit SecD [Deltaproteobacteria bacterium]HPP80453.1 protein translocase subunit SecD [Deltaproteobacteria bacterium]
MDRFKVRGILILAVLVAAVVLALPSFLGKTELPQGWIGPKSKLRLGLDLQGGIHMVLKVDSLKAVENRLNTLAGDLKPHMIENRIKYTSVAFTAPDKITVDLRGADDYDALSKLMADSYPNLVEVDRKDEPELTRVVYQLKDAEVKAIRSQAVDQALETIRNRIDQFGVTEPSIVPQSGEKIVLQLPGVTDPERAKRLIGRTAVLEFKLVDEEHSVEEALQGKVPEGSYVAYMRDGKQPILLKETAVLTGSMLNDAQGRISPSNNMPYVAISFNPEGARVFERVTSENVGKRLAIVLDGKVYSAPVIRDAIAGGKAVIEGRFTDQEARDLALVLRSGALPAPVDIIEERTVGPSLGEDSIRMGVYASLVGAALVVIFMVVYYKVSGLIANVALAANIVMLVAVMALFHATLTLPGIAGIGLTIGMAVDANILVFERIREEIRLGRTPVMALDAGYKNALWTILDANITTLIAAVVLFQFGTGPIKGFAVTLSVGILTTLFTTLIMSKWIQEWLVNSLKVEEISI